MPLIMITNDDGIDSPGLKALQEAMAALGQDGGGDAGPG